MTNYYSAGGNDYAWRRKLAQEQLLPSLRDKRISRRYVDRKAQVDPKVMTPKITGMGRTRQRKRG